MERTKKNRIFRPKIKKMGQILRIKRILEDKEKLVQMGKNARENIFNVCSGDVICKKETDLLKSVIKN